MKKTTAIITAMAAMLNIGGISAFAEDAPEPADIPAVIYSQLMERDYNDLNKDKILDEEELSKITYAYLRLGDCTDMSWLGKMKSLEYLTLIGENEVDVSGIAQLDSLENLSLEGLPITDISFLKDMNLEAVSLNKMDQITLEQRLAVMKWEDVTIERGTMMKTGAFPEEILYPFDIKFRIENTDIADLEYPYIKADENGRYMHTCNANVYAREKGETEYSIYIGDERIISGKITVVDAPQSSLPPVTGDYVGSSTEIARNVSDTMVLINQNGSFAIRDRRLIRLGDLPVSFQNASISSNYSSGTIYGDLMVMPGGTARFCDDPVNSDKYFINGAHEYLLSDDGEVYVVKYNKFGPVVEFLTDNISDLIDTNMSYLSDYAVSSDGEVIYLRGKYTAKGMEYAAYPTGIRNIILHDREFFVDGDNVLWYVIGSSSGPEVKKIAENVISINDCNLIDDVPNSPGASAGGMFSESVYMTADGKTYNMDGEEVTVNEYHNRLEKLFRDSGTIADMPRRNGREDMFYIGNDSIMTIMYDNRLRTVSDVTCFMGSNYKPDDPMIYFVRKDGSVWEYACVEDKFTELTPEELSSEIRGDANGDGAFSTSDLVLTAQYLLGRDVKPDLANIDLNGDGTVDTFDLAAMRSELKVVTGKSCQ